MAAIPIHGTFLIRDSQWEMENWSINPEHGGQLQQIWHSYAPQQGETSSEAS
ncbi:hypothetical protein PISMIDRAFT_678800 [Pisolithus microcarpus 441]|uniref:Unplaced genomic scaffold scaffold_38, whole genome shotgun sequence n=1 Tax=Pisolithus microcarpus 441 TaxID=765257 RepID=A0A0C9ZD00_9AGAM|nr:hypothetical protein PISMIDRAFT_678800 [Pisolithus microcarpus 441]